MSASMKIPFLMSAALSLVAGDPSLPLPEAPVRLLIPNVAAFDAVLKGPTRAFLRSSPKPGDPVVAAFRRTQVGTKLEAQWTRFSGDLALDWEGIRKLQTRALGLALLDVGHLEAVLVLDTPLAALPASFPSGERKSHGGQPYAFVTPGAADHSEDPERRMGLAWARRGSLLIIATSERALLLALDRAQAAKPGPEPLAGLASLDLDLDALRTDRYFRREFLFPPGPETGTLRAALRVEQGHLVEVREGQGEPRSGVFTFEAPGAAASGWEPQGTAFWGTFRRALLEPMPTLSDKPQAALASLPAAEAGNEDRYSVDLTRPRALPGQPPWEEGDLAPWRTLLARQPIPQWGFWVGPDGSRRMVFPWPEALDGEFTERCRTSLARRAGRTTLARTPEGAELRIGPGLPVLALRRTGGFLWVGRSLQDLQGATTPAPDASLVRWAKVDLGAVRAEGARWAQVEGPARPEQVRPFSDRVLGLLGWFPATRSLSVERRRTASGSGWTERIVFGGTP